MLSKEWFKAWKKSKNEKPPILQQKVNADLLHSNPYNYPKDNLFKGNDIILQNDLEPEVNYMLVTQKAWAIIQDNFPCHTLRKRFFLDQNDNFQDIDRNFAVNLIIFKNTMTKKLVNLEYPDSIFQFLQGVLGQQFQEQYT